MRRIALSLSVLGETTQAPAPRIRANAVAIVEIVGNYRRLVLRDSAAVDYCAASNMWNADGTFIARAEAADLNSYSDGDECPRTPAANTPNVVARALTPRQSTRSKRGVGIAGSSASCSVLDALTCPKLQV